MAPSALPRHTITEQQAVARAEQILRQTAEAITPKPRLESYMPDTGPCLVNPNDTKDTRVQVIRTYWLRGIQRNDNASVGEQILRYWQQQGYIIFDQHGIGTSQPEISGTTRPDDFGISLDWSANGALSISTSSPCVWPDGSAPPGV